MNRTMIYVIAAFATVALILSVMAWRKGGGGTLRKGWGSGWETFSATLPALFLAMGIAGLAQVLIPAETIAKWVGHGAGWRGVWIGCLAGILAPGGPFVVFPMAAGFFKMGASVETLVAFVVSWSMWGARMIVLESALISPRFAMVKLVSCFLFPPMAGGIALYVNRLFR